MTTASPSLVVIIHRYAGTTEDRTVRVPEHGLQYAQGLHTAGYKGNVRHVAELIDAGHVVHVEQFAITCYREDLQPETREHFAA